MTSRVNVILSPFVSIQVFAQPLIAAEDYFGFKELARPRTFDFSEYGTAIGSITRDAADASYTSTRTGSGTPDRSRSTTLISACGLSR